VRLADGGSQIEGIGHGLRLAQSAVGRVDHGLVLHRVPPRQLGDVGGQVGTRPRCSRRVTLLTECRRKSKTLDAEVVGTTEYTASATVRGQPLVQVQISAVKRCVVCPRSPAMAAQPLVAR
jgi:hypothetical protein